MSKEQREGGMMLEWLESSAVISSCMSQYRLYMNVYFPASIEKGPIRRRAQLSVS